MPTCRICESSDHHNRFTAREMMFGLRESFEYFQCISCGCLQIAQIPEDLSKYYPEDYYSFSEAPESKPIKRFFKQRWASQLLYKPNLLGMVLQRRYGVPAMFDWIRRAGIGFDQAILDVGCGGGQFLQTLHNLGFNNLTGVDPFVDRDTRFSSGVRVLKRTLHKMDGKFDFIILNHSFEHMEDPQDSLAHIHRLLEPGRIALLRLPVAGGYAWRTYGVDWVQLDAPRHLFLHTEKSIGILCEKAGLELADTVYDGTAFQFWGSEQYRKDIPLKDDRSYDVNPGRAGFTEGQMQEYNRLAEELNAKGDADQACFYVRKRLAG
ncbi:MAG: class I SAM-dependent methyltransferase [Candidatus Latescibacterota bacterium]